jgi:glycosyltransferase involved in cell wall biosynthesis
LIAGMLGLRVATRARVLVTFHELYNEWGGGPRAWVVALLHRLQFFAFGALAHTLVFTTEWRCALARRWFFWKRPRVRWVPVGANVLPPESAPPPRAPRPVICTFGLLQRGVYLEELLRALGALVHEEGVDVTLRVLGDWSGAEPPRRRRIEELVETLDLQGHVEWSGPQPAAEISRLLTTSDVYVCWRTGCRCWRTGRSEWMWCWRSAAW